MTYRLYKPHVTNADGDVTTPDLMVDRVEIYVAGSMTLMPVHRLTPDVELQTPAGNLNVTPAIVLISAGGGSLLSVAAIVRPCDCSLYSADVLISRTSWRLRHLRDRLQTLSMELEIPNHRESTKISAILDGAPVVQEADDESALARGVMQIYAADALTVTTRAPAAISVALTDPNSDRPLSCRVQLVPVDSTHWQERPASRYTTGPVEEVKHYI